ncbi:MAG: hypothetical protein AAFX46_10640, partial [Cyanobacteria bacterium J06636_27]
IRLIVFFPFFVIVSTISVKFNFSYLVDGKQTKFPKPGASSTWTAYKGGKIKFDTDGRNNYKEWKKYNLSDGGVYAFRDNKGTKGNPYDIDLVRIG